MAVYKRGKIYWYDFWFNGERYQASTKTRNLRTAEQIEAKAKTDLALGLYGLAPLKPAPSLTKYAERFREFVRTRHKAHPETISFYLEKLGRLLEFRALADSRLNRIDEAMIDQYIQHRRGQVNKPATVNRELATLRRLLHVASDVHKLIARVPRIKLLPGETEREFVLSQDQEKSYLAVAEDTLRDFAILSLDTGVRAGEGVTLEWMDVHFEPAPKSKFGYIQIRERGRKKRGRILSMTPRVKATLENRRRFLPDAVHVFPGRSKDRHILVSSLDHQHVRARIKAKDDGEKPIFTTKDFVIHSLRHTFGTRLGESGADAFTIMKIMGHASVTVSQRYVHPTPERLESAFARLNAMNEFLREGKIEVPTEVTTGEK